MLTPTKLRSLSYAVVSPIEKGVCLRSAGLFHHHETNAFASLATRTGERLHFGVGPLHAKVVPVLCRKLAPVRLLHGLQASDLPRVACTTVHDEGGARWQSVIDLDYAFDRLGNHMAKCCTSDLHIGLLLLCL
ncbi:unnamed protein product [Periconia digitata]|uniref:Uncharacterized protein n=1 Tax=Periconia digitata TaxID=1303443 RepID=A0A9W4XPE5_9PLEO|nr:unnamed protein product [Periconia digitata]